MTEHDDELFALAIVQPAAVAVKVGRLKAHVRAEPQDVVQTVLRAATEDGAVLAERFDALDPQQPLQRRDFFIKMVVDPFFVVHDSIFLLYLIIALINGICTGLSGVIV